MWDHSVRMARRVWVTQMESPGGECGVSHWERPGGEESVGSLSVRGQGGVWGNSVGESRRSVGSLSGLVEERLQECKIMCWLGDIRKCKITHWVALEE